MEKSGQNILVLGGNGMLGRIVYAYLSSIFPQRVWKTQREKDRNSFTLRVEHVESDFAKIELQLTKIQYIINCIGALRNSSTSDLELVNAKFPHQLVKLAGMKGRNIIHISTDAVFGSLEGIVTEKDIPIPDSTYGKSKLAGEVTAENFLTFRTSILGFDTLHHKGLLEWAIETKENPLVGFSNQIWSGCTVLQYAMLCEKIISRDSFNTLQKISSVFHFSPITPISKYQLVKDFLACMKIEKNIKKTKGKTITRILSTKYEKELYLREFKNIHVDTLKELIKFERMLI